MPITKTSLCPCGRELWPNGVGNALACVCGKGVAEPITWTLADLRRDAVEFAAANQHEYDLDQHLYDFLTYLIATYGEFVPEGKDSSYAS